MIPQSTYAFELQFIPGVIAALLAYLYYGWQQDRQRIGAWFDVSLLSAVVAVIGGRALHLIIEYEYFSTYPVDVFDIWYAGFAWHAALAGGLLGMWLGSYWRSVSVREVGDGMALALPIVMLSGWWACRSGGCAVGKTVTNDTYPSFLTGFLPDTFGSVEQRLEIQVIGALASLVVLWVSAWMLHHQRFNGQRLWIVIVLISLLMFGLGFGRGDDVLVRGGLRIDQWLDLATASIGLVGLSWARHIHHKKQGATATYAVSS